MKKTREIATGAWPYILQSFGVDSSFLKNVHGPCPACGGNDRFRFDDREGSGSFFCSSCGSGDGFNLLQLVKGWEFQEAAKQIDELIGDGHGIPRHAPRKDHDPEKARRNLRAVWAEAKISERVHDYQAYRGLPKIHYPNLRWHDGLPYRHNGEFIGIYPAMVAMISGPDGTPQSIHRTFFGKDIPGSTKKIMTPIDTVKGGAIRLGEPAAAMAVTEGIETGLAVTEMTGLPVWAAISAGGMEALEIPDCVEQLHIFGDNDSSFTGQKAAYTLAYRVRRQGRQVSVDIPAVADTDWLDHYIKLNGAKNGE